MRLAERFGEPDVDAFMERITPEQFVEWSWFDALEVEDAKRDGHVSVVKQRMAERTGA